MIVNKGGNAMPVISRFNGIAIKMYLRQKEHNPPHIRAIYGDYTWNVLIIRRRNV